MGDTIDFHGVELDVEDTRTALEAATDENGDLTSIGESGSVIIIGDHDADGHSVIANTDTDNSYSGWIAEPLGDEIAMDVYDEEFFALKDATDGSFDIDVRDVEVVDARDDTGDYNAMVVVEDGKPWNMENNSGGWPYDDFTLRYFRTVDEKLPSWVPDVEMDNVGAVFYFMLDES